MVGLLHMVDPVHLAKIGVRIDMISVVEPVMTHIVAESSYEDRQVV